MKNWTAKFKKQTALIAVTLSVLAISAPTTSQAQTPAQLDKLVVAGWSKPITEITNLLVEEDKGFFKARGIELGYVPGAGGGDAGGFGAASADRGERAGWRAGGGKRGRDGAAAAVSDARRDGPAGVAAPGRPVFARRVKRCGVKRWGVRRCGVRRWGVKRWGVKRG